MGWSLNSTPSNTARSMEPPPITHKSVARPSNSLNPLVQVSNSARPVLPKPNDVPNSASWEYCQPNIAAIKYWPSSASTEYWRIQQCHPEYWQPSRAMIEYYQSKRHPFSTVNPILQTPKSSGVISIVSSPNSANLIVPPLDTGKLLMLSSKQRMGVVELPLQHCCCYHSSLCTKSAMLVLSYDAPSVYTVLFLLEWHSVSPLM